MSTILVRLLQTNSNHCGHDPTQRQMAYFYASSQKISANWMEVNPRRSQLRQRYPDGIQVSQTTQWCSPVVYSWLFAVANSMEKSPRPNTAATTIPLKEG